MSNDTELSQDIMKIIQIAAVNGTLTKESVDYVKNILEENKQLSEKNDWNEQEIASLTIENYRLKEDINELKSRESKIIEREEDISEREEKITELELEAKFQLIRVQDHKEMFGLVFRNIETRSKVFTPVSGTATCNGYVKEDEKVERNT